MAKSSISNKSEFLAPLRVGKLFEDFPKPCLIAGGWAVDLYLGALTRPHKDLEVAVMRDDQEHLRSFLSQKTEANFKKVNVEGKLVRWQEAERLELPIHEIHATFPKAKDAAGLTKLEILLNESSGQEWIFRRDTRVRLSLDRLVVEGPEGLKLLNPAVVLLYKAKSPRSIDENDFKRLAPALSYADREWFRESLRTLQGTHPWLERLSILNK